MQIREYAGPLGILAAAMLGFGLLCSVSALAMNDLNNHDLVAIESLNIMELAVTNLNNSAALTQQAVAAFVSTPTAVPTNTAFLTPKPAISNTAIILSSLTPNHPTQTRRPRATIAASSFPTQTRLSLPTATETSIPTDTPPPSPTDTPLPPPTDTEIPPSDTPLPPPTDTEIPPTEPPVQISTLSP